MMDVSQTQALFEIYGIHISGFDGLCLECKQPSPCRTRTIIDSSFKINQTITSVACKCGTAGVQWENGVGYVPYVCQKCNGENSEHTE